MLTDELEAAANVGMFGPNSSWSNSELLNMHPPSTLMISPWSMVHDPRRAFHGRALPDPLVGQALPTSARRLRDNRQVPPMDRMPPCSGSTPQRC